MYEKYLFNKPYRKDIYERKYSKMKNQTKNKGANCNYKVQYVE